MGKLDRLLDNAAEAVERADWATALSLAEEIARLDAGNEDAAAIRTLARLRASRSPVVPRGTRRRMTILFADIVDSTRLASQLDPEETRDTLLAFQAACGEVVARFDGHIAQFIGDGVLVYYGHPRAHEDDAARAVLTGLEIVRRVRDLSGGTVEVAVRVGIHTGLVVIADMGVVGRVQANDVVGEAPNVAARIHVAARPGTVVMSAETHDLVRGVMDATVLPPMTIKGIDRPVRLFEAVGERTGQSRFDAAGRPRGALIGRKGEQEVVAGAWAGVVATARAAGLALLGEPGIGKSRLAAFAKDHVHAYGGMYRTLQCSPYHLSTPLYPVSVGFQREARRSAQALAACDPTTLVDPADRYALARLLGDDPVEPSAGAELTPEELRERLFTVTLAGLRRLADEAPLLLVVEDLHWADPTTLEVLARLLRSPAPVSILLLVTSRDPGPLERVGSLPTVELGPLPVPEGEQLVAQIAPPELGEAVRSLIVEHGGGVPLFLEELTRMLAEAAPATASAAQLSIPPTLQDLLVARVDQF
ncbi:MAG TPA: adenylate/guanylate cyclase domain-containing protein, partial [Acidimicrobiia bacterium]|nr:adenylate/guanylate cyclase domain-containing protein [Acidimicrobiia bacterium]